MLDLTKPETYEMLIAENLFATALVRKYNLDITPECLRFRIRAFKKDGKVRIAQRTSSVTKEQLEAWVNEGLTISQVYVQTGIPHNFLYAACKQHGLKFHDGRKRTHNKNTDVARIQELMDQGLSDKEIAKEMDLSFQRTKDYTNKLRGKDACIRPVANTKFDHIRMSVLTQKWGNGLCL